MRMPLRRRARRRKRRPAPAETKFTVPAGRQSNAGQNREMNAFAKMESCIERLSSESQHSVLTRSPSA